MMKCSEASHELSPLLQHSVPSIFGTQAPSVGACDIPMRKLPEEPPSSYEECTSLTI